MPTLAQSFGEALAAAGMDTHGMLPRQPCRQCGKPLNGDGRHPAELYAGTFTGLCYSCQNSGRYVVETYPDGARLLSFPPHCPSWRRDREEYIAYENCPDCQGKGHITVSRSCSQGGPYPIHCSRCLTRFYKTQER